MNESSDISNQPLPLASTGAPLVSAPLPMPWWRRFLACNPFYLVSAALLLYGFYLVSADPNFLRREIAQLFFNFGSLQVYEVLLVITALFLVGRQVWYDSTLLVGLENLLVLVPFILISQAALIDIHWVWSLCLVAGLAAVVRFAALKRFFAQLNIPNPLATIGLLVLLMNVAWPITYRILHEHKVGKLPTSGAAYLANEFSWLLLLPALCALANFVPLKPRKNQVLPQSFWIPAGLCSLWLIGTVVHLYCLGYVYDFPLRHELVAPMIWVLLWILSHRWKEFAGDLEVLWQRTALALPLLATLLGLSEAGTGVFLGLTLLNLALYGSISLKRRDRFARCLLLISSLALIAGLPEDWRRIVLPGFSRGDCLGAGAALYFVFRAALSHNPKLGLFGALVTSFAVTFLLGTAAAPHWGIQSGLAFLLLHSLRWTENQHEGTGAVRFLASLGWVAHTLWWMHDGGAGWMTCAVACPVLAGCLLARWLAGGWLAPIVPISATAVLLAGPGNAAAGTLQSTPVGLLAVAGSFILFALGTCTALTKHRWLH